MEPCLRVTRLRSLLCLFTPIHTLFTFLSRLLGPSVGSRGYSDLTEYLCTTDCVPLPADPAIKSRGGQNCFSLAPSTFNKGISREMMAHFRTARKILRQRKLKEKQHKQEQVVVIVDDDDEDEEEEEEEDVIVIRKL